MIYIVAHTTSGPSTGERSVSFEVFSNRAGVIERMDNFSIDILFTNEMGSAQRKTTAPVLVSASHVEDLEVGGADAQERSVFIAYQACNDEWYIARRDLETKTIEKRELKEVPTALIGVDNQRCLLGYNNHIDRVVWRAPDEIKIKVIHEFQSGASFKAIDAFAMENRRIVAIDDIMWPKYCISFHIDADGSKIRYVGTGKLPNVSANAQYKEASLAGDSLICTARSAHRGGTGNTLVVATLDNKGSVIRENICVKEFLPRVRGPSKLQIVLHSKPARFTEWAGLGHVAKDTIVLGCSERGVLVVKFTDIGSGSSSSSSNAGPPLQRSVRKFIASTQESGLVDLIALPGTAVILQSGNNSETERVTGVRGWCVRCLVIGEESGGSSSSSDLAGSGSGGAYVCGEGIPIVLHSQNENE